MFLCAIVLASATAMLTAAPAAAEAPRCEAMNFRVYFAEGSAQLGDEAQRMLEIAARGVADCAYAELRVRVDGPMAAERGAAIVAAADGRAWDAVRLQAGGMQVASHRAGPAHAEVTMTPEPSAPARGDAGV